MKGFWQWFATLVLALIVIIGANSVPALKRIDAITDQHRRPLVAITLSITIVGWLIFMGSLIYYSVKGGRVLSTEEVEETARQVKYRNASFSTIRYDMLLLPSTTSRKDIRGWDCNAAPVRRASWGPTPCIARNSASTP